MVNSSDSVRIRIVIPAFLWLPIAAALIGRFYVVQIKKHDYYMNAAQEICTAEKKLEGRWGEIRDRDNYLLGGNSPCFQITCSPCNIKPEKRRIAAKLLGKYLDKSAKYYYRRLTPTQRVVDKNGNEVERPHMYLMLGRNISLETGKKLREELGKNGVSLNAFSFKPAYTRVYPKKKMLANFIGYSNVDGDVLKPQMGLEKGVSAETAPHEGQIKMEISRGGSPLDYGVQDIKASRDGKNVYLTISEPVQSILEEELDAAWKKWNPDAIYAAIATPDGQILAIAQRPTFDLSDRSTFNNDTIRNRMIRDAFEPGSVMKPFTVVKALDWGVVTKDTMIDGEKGRWLYGGKILSDTHDYGIMTVGKVIQKSSNIGTAKIALMLGEEQLFQALSSFGFGTKTGLLPHENAGTEPRPRKGDKIAITRIPIGYSINVTSLQLLRAYCTLANGGRCPQLRLVDRVEDPATGKSDPVPVEEAVQVVEHPEALKQLTAMLVTVTQKGGTAEQAAIPGYDVAGKTGTSNKYVIEYYPDEPGKPRRVKWQGYKNKAPDKQYYASFAGFVPAHDPKIVVVITVDNPKGDSHFGGSVAGPIFSRTAKRVLDHLNIPPDHPEELIKEKPRRRTVLAQTPAAPVKPRAKTPKAEPAPARKTQRTARPASRNRTRTTTAAPTAERRSGRRQSSASGLPTMRNTWGEQQVWP